VFDVVVAPYLESLVDNWDNLSGDELADFPDTFAVEDCRQLCEEDLDCMQFRYAPGKCWVSKDIQLGKPENPDLEVASGWMVRRIQTLSGASTCERSADFPGEDTSSQGGNSI
jgi:hypothetical protein